MLISKNGHSINSVPSWFEFAPPKEGARQWVDSRSAKELAKAFCGDEAVTTPTELAELLSSSQALGVVELTEGWPEHKIQLDSFRGETRNADLAAIAKRADGVVAVTVEAKADESFGDTIGGTVRGAGATSNVPARVESLARGVLGVPADTISNLRYQLLHGAAATLIFAAECKATAAVFAVLEFSSESSSAPSLLRNSNDLAAFISALAGRPVDVRDRRLLGPFRVPGGGRVPGSIPLFVGKATIDLRRRAV